MQETSPHSGAKEQILFRKKPGAQTRTRTMSYRCQRDAAASAEQEVPCLLPSCCGAPGGIAIDVSPRQRFDIARFQFFEREKIDMNEFIAGVVRAAAETFPAPEPVLEVGSYQVEGQESLADLRKLFASKAYQGIDMRPGPGVDSVENVEHLPRSDASVGTVLALNVFEHVERFWLGFQEMQRVLRPDGLLIVSCPFYFHIHNYPADYWRFTPEALRSLLRDFPSLIVGWHGPKGRPLNVWAVAAGAEYPPFTREQHAAFQARIRQYAHQRLGFSRQLRYTLGGWLFGRGPFAPRLDAEQFQTEFYRAA